MIDALFSLQEYLITIYSFFFHRAQCSFENQCSRNPVTIEKERIFMKIVILSLVEA